MVNTLYFMPNADASLLGILNSTLMDVYYSRVSNQIRGGYRRSFTQYISELPIVAPNPDLKKKVKELLTLAVKKGSADSGVIALEGDIDELVFNDYGVNAADARVIRDLAEAS